MRVLVIGAGPSGLVAAKVLKEANPNYEVNYIWRMEPNLRGVYPNGLHRNLFSALLCLPYFFSPTSFCFHFLVSSLLFCSYMRNCLSILRRWSSLKVGRVLAALTWTKPTKGRLWCRRLIWRLTATSGARTDLSTWPRTSKSSLRIASNAMIAWVRFGCLHTRPGMLYAAVS
jgi:cation diffusion facilitator CzcD-associated flavoprotein CzcO